MSCVSQTHVMNALHRLGRIVSLHRSLEKGTLRLTSIVTFQKPTVRRGHTMGGIHPGNFPPLTKNTTKDTVPEETFSEEDEIDPADAFEGKNAYKMILPNYESENFSFDPDTGILQEREDEMKHFEDVIKPKKDGLDKIHSVKFGDVARDIDRHIPREFELSSDQSEWNYVERLLPLRIVPPLPRPPNKDGSYPSGFCAPRIKPGDLPYHVSRTRSHMLPVYTVFNRLDLLVTTHISRCDGNLHQLKEDLNNFLTDRYEREFMSQAAELYGKVKFRGDFEQDFKEFLIEKGF